MSKLVKTIEVPENVRKVSFRDAICPKTIEIYTDKLIAKSDKRELAIDLRKYSGITVKEAGLKNNLQFAQVYFLTPSEVDLAYQPSKSEAYSGKVDACFEFGSGMYSYTEANEYAHYIAREMEEWILQNKSNLDNLQESLYSDAVYSINGVRGRSLAVFEDKVIITVTTTIGSILTGNVTDGQKTIYYSDVIGVQYKPPGFTIGYLQLETASTQMNNRKDNFFNENSFTFDKTSVDLDLMNEVAEYVKKRVDEHHKIRTAPAIIQTGPSITEKSSVDQIKEFKELLDMGIISNEEFELKKNELLGITVNDSHANNMHIPISEIDSNTDIDQFDTVIDEKAVPAQNPASNRNVIINPNSLEPTIVRIELFLEKNNWEQAIEYANAALEYFPTDYRLYMYLLCAELNVSKAEDLNTVIKSFRDNVNYRLVKRFATDEISEQLDSALSIVEANEKERKEAEEIRREEERKCGIYREACSLLNNKTVSNYTKAITLLEQIGEWEDATTKAEKCRAELIEMKRSEAEAILVAAKEEAGKDVIGDLKRLKSFLDEGIINEDEFNNTKDILLKAETIDSDDGSEITIETRVECEAGDSKKPVESVENESKVMTNNQEEPSRHGGVTFISENEVRLENFDGFDEWLVLDKKGDKFLLISKFCQGPKIITESPKYDWGTSWIRNYLNTSFMEKFTPEQRDVIVQPDPSFIEGDDIHDKVFLLSSEEYTKYKSLMDNGRNAWKDASVKLGWALRTEGGGSRIVVVNKIGELRLEKIKTLYLGASPFGIRPAICIDLSKL